MSSAKKKNKISKYNKLRNQLQTGDIVAFQGSDAGALVIRKGTNSPYSHVGLVIRFNDIDRNFILESVTSKGVVLMPLSRKLLYYAGKAWWVPLDSKKKNVTLDVRKKIFYAAMQQLGKEYDYENIKAMVKKILGFTSGITKEDFGSFICSELTAYAYKEAGVFPAAMVTSEVAPIHIVGLPVMAAPVEIV